MANNRKLDTESIFLGLMPPLSGLVSMYGAEITWAGRIACDEINASGGVLGRPLKLVIADDGSLPETAVPAARSLVEDHNCHALIGNLLSNSRIAVADLVATPHRIPYLNFSFYEGSIFSKYFFHFAALPNQQIDKMIPYMAAHYGPKMFFAGSNYEWPRGSIHAAKKILLNSGGEIVGEEYLPIGSSDIDRLLDMVGTSGADVFVPYFAGTDQINLLTRFSHLGLKSKMSVVMGHYDEVMVSNLPPKVRAGFFSSNTYFMSINTPENNSYHKQLAGFPEVTGIWPHGNGMLTNFGEGTYLCVKAFAQAAEQAKSIEAEKLVQSLETIEVLGPQGLVVMDPKTHHAAVNSYLACCNEDGTFSIREQFGKINPEIPSRYQHKFHDIKNIQSDIPSDMHSETGAGKQQAAEFGFQIGEQVNRFKAALFIFEESGKIFFLNDTACSLVNITDSSTLLNESINALLIEPDLLWQQIKKLKKHWHGILQFRDTNGFSVEMQVTLNPYYHNPHAQTSYIITCIPRETITSSETDREIISQVDIAIIATDEKGIIMQVNRHALELFGYGEDELNGTSVHLLLPPNYRQKHEKYFKRFSASSLTEVPMGKRPEIAGYRKDGSLFPAEASISKFQGKNGWIFVATLRDITERKKAEKHLTWQATHDPLTSLPNKKKIRDRMNNALQRSKQTGENIALLFVDLDNFKLINDSYGHDFGDQLLVTVAKRLTNHVRPGDTVARFGGDEFVILCEQVGNPADISTLAMRINDFLRAPILIAGQKNFLTSSIGIAIGHGSTHSSEQLLRNADTAMYLAKDQGKDGWRFYNENIHEQAKQQLSLSSALRDAIEHKKLSLFLQPIVDTPTGQIQGAEALLRWYHQGNFVPPDIFIPIAELTGIISKIGYWVFEEGCRQLAAINQTISCDTSFYISINVSARQLNDENLVDNFYNIIEKNGVLPHQILIEITETSLMADVELNLKILRKLSALGLKVAVDDFGTGYSSLSQLLRLPVNHLKIDRLFISQMEFRKENRTVVTAIITMAHALGLQVIAEGVETEQQHILLNEIGCDFIQGFYFYKPMPFDDFMSLLTPASLNTVA